MQLTHHAYYIEGPPSLFGEYAEALKPFWAQEYERLGIEEARELIQLASLKNAQRSVFLIGAASLSSESQQALLKLFEEPQRGLVFIVLLPHGALLPTLRSRMLPYPTPLAPRMSVSVKKFLQASGAARSEEITKMLKDDDGVKERARDFVNALEAELYTHIDKKGEVREGLADIAKVRSYLGDRSPSLKMLLEHLAMSLPKLP